MKNINFLVDYVINGNNLDLLEREIESMTDELFKQIYNLQVNEQTLISFDYTKRDEHWEFKVTKNAEDDYNFEGLMYYEEYEKFENVSLDCIFHNLVVYLDDANYGYDVEEMIKSLI